MLLEQALSLAKKGYNIILTKNKVPLGRWSSSTRWSVQRIQRLAEEADGVAVVAGKVGENRWLVIVDVDDPRRLSDLPLDISNFPQWKTGVRCPLHPDVHGDVSCEGDVCRHENHTFKLSEAPRGIAFAFVTDFDPGEGVVGIGVEVKTRSYQLIPPSRHPSGTQYEWIRELPHPNELPIVRRDEYERLILWAKGFVVKKYEVAGRTVVTTNVRAPICNVYRRLKDYDSMVSTLLPYYKKGQRNYVVFAFASTAARYCIVPEDVLIVVDKLTAITNDEERTHRFYVTLWCYGFVGSGNPKLPSMWRILQILGRDFSIAFTKELEKQLGFLPLLPLSQARHFEDGLWMLVYDVEKDVVSLKDILRGRLIDIFLTLPNIEDGYIVIKDRKYPLDNLGETAQKMLSDQYVATESVRHILRALKLLLTPEELPKT